MFCIIEHLAPVPLEMRDGVGNHGEILLKADLKHLEDVERPGLAHDGHGGRFCIQQQLHLGVVLNLHLAAACHPKRGDSGVFPGTAGSLRKEGGVLRVRSGPSPLDVMHAEGVSSPRP